MTALTDSQFRWILEHLRVPQNVGPTSIMLMGDGPLDSTEWQRALFALGHDVYFPDQYHATLLVGRRNWSKQILLDLLEARRGLKVRIVSQEMMLAWLATRRDPFDDAPEHVRELWGDHPVYQFLDDGDGDGPGFDWPSLDVQDEPEDGSAVLGGWGVGLLSAAGYRVGGDGEHVPTRHAALRRAYESNAALAKLPEAKRNYCGPAGSLRRLEVIASTMAKQYKLARSRPERALAIHHWEQDLHWLHSQFYLRDRSAKRWFDWPTLDADDRND
ncbi:hypothetical protein [Gemmatimonas sp.]|uniref:hypothetical protein n=1 Tax=Gemmatimonas sp. TaxID=1962908 RepID=UPI003DA31899